jgi:hypothetical protein
MAPITMLQVFLRSGITRTVLVLPTPRHKPKWRIDPLICLMIRASVFFFVIFEELLPAGPVPAAVKAQCVAAAVSFAFPPGGDP